MPQLEDAAGVCTYYEEHGQGEPVALLHGALEGGAIWDFAAPALATQHRVLVPDRRGHGRTPDVLGAYTYSAMADESIAFLEQVAGRPAHLIGYSDGGAIALEVALRRPELVRSIALISAHLSREGIVPQFLARLDDPNPSAPQMTRLRDAYAENSPDGVEHWPVFHRKVSEMGSLGPTLTTRALGTIDCPALVISVDDDVIDLRHTLSIYEALPNAQLCVFPGASHALPQEKPAELLWLLQSFLKGEPPKRLMPVKNRTKPS